MEGWIKLYRKVLDNPVICKDSDHIAVWMHLLLNATHKEHPALFSGQKITLRPGQLITGRKAIADKYKISESKVQRILKTFESEQQIEQQTANKNRLVSILSWGEYQGSEQQDEHQVNNKRTTSEQQVNTNKNVKNIENEKNGEEEYSAAAEAGESEAMIDEVHREIFGTMFMSGVMSQYVRELKQKGCTDQFIAEAMREAGESSPRPNLKFLKAISDRWIKEGVNSRAESNALKQKGGMNGGRYQAGDARRAEADREAASRNEELFVGSPRGEPTGVDREFAESLKDFR